MRIFKVFILLHSCLLWSDYAHPQTYIQDNGMCETNCCVKPCPCIEVFDGTTLNCDSRFWVQGEILVWKHQMLDTLDAYAEVARANDSLLADRRQRDKYVECDWLPGVRVGLGYKIPCDTLDVLGLFTYVPGHGAKKERSSRPNLGIGTYFGIHENDSTGVEDFDVELNSNLYIGDLELGRHFFVTPGFDVRPFVGLRGIYHNSKANNRIENEFEMGLLTLVRGDLTKIDNIFGIGIRFGLNTLWGVTERWAVYMNWAAAMLGTSSSHETNLSYTVATGANEADVHNLFGSPTVEKQSFPFGDCEITNELALGIQYDYFFCNRRYHLGFRAGYEFLNLFVQEFFSAAKNNYQGVTVGARFDF